MNTILADLTVSVTELEHHFADLVKQADNAPIAVLNHNRPEAYLLPAACYEQLVARLEDLEDLEDARLVRDRAQGPFIEISLDDL